MSPPLTLQTTLPATSVNPARSPQAEQDLLTSLAFPFPNFSGAHVMSTEDVSNDNPPAELLTEVDDNTQNGSLGSSEGKAVTEDTWLDNESPGLTPFSHESCYLPRHSSGI